MPEEKLYIQFDKPYYSTGDTIRLKAYLFDAAFLSDSKKSGIAYLELANDTNKVLLHRMLHLEAGLGMGDIVLNKEDIPEGSYTIRAYTNLMRNFGEDLIFKKSFYVSGSSSKSWLVNSKVSLSKLADKDNLHMELQFNKLDKQSLGLHELELRIRDGKKILMRDKVETDVEGKLDVNFNLPEKTDPGNISLIVADLVKGQEDHKITIPLPVNRPENTDLQFMPEGGNLVAGITSVVGFKAIGEDGKGVNISGKVFSGSRELTDFASSYKGMGSFEISPKEGETYTARVILNGIEKSFPLPAVKSAGTAIKINNQIESDSIEVTISAIAPSPATAYYLIAQSRGIICYGATIRFSATHTIIKKIDKSLFPTGIVRFTLMSADRQPLNERIAYISHNDNLNVTLSPAKASFGIRDSISLNIRVTDKNNQPVHGSFSLAVTDDNQVRTDSLGSNILTSLLVTSDLKGLVEDPGHYMEQTEQAWKDLDHLLLAQGWTGYNWKDVFNPPAPAYAAEPEFIVRGRVTNVFNKASTATGIRLLSFRPPFVKDTLTKKDGSFTYSGLPLVDTLAFFIQARNKNSKSFNVGIDMDEFKPAVFSAPGQRFMPWYVNSDTSLLKYVKTIVQQKEENIKLGGNVLAEVIITAKKIIKGSKNLNGPGESDQALDERELQKAEKTTLLQLLKDRITGFNEGEFPHPTHHPMANNEPLRWSYRIGLSEIRLVIDGMDVEKFYTGAYYYELPDINRLKYHRERFDYIKDYLLFFTAEDVKGIEVMFHPRYNSRYNSTELSGPELLANDPSANDFAYIEITTKSGKGAFERRIPGTFTYKPMPFILPKEFYRPRYTAKSTIPLGMDLRSTIHWEPNIVTDGEGKAQVSFYSADSPGTYSIIMEGSDMNGALGRQTGTLTIK
ncbi:MAG TPA: hypothetical protein DIT07_10895 [Sphingobacteriaceae bacterium]|nr:hypothetical protein [Sphingobacteriaceae bacterium]